MKILRCYFTLAINILVLGTLLTGCNSAMQAYKDGVRKFDNGEYDLAIKGLQKAEQANYEPLQTSFLIAESYRLSNRFKESIPYYKKALDGGITNPEAQFQYAYALKTTGQYQEASISLPCLQKHRPVPRTYRKEHFEKLRS